MRHFRRALRWGAASLTALCLTAFLGGRAPAQENNFVDTDAKIQQGVEPLAYGPVHEALAEPITFDAKPGLIVAAQPPEPVAEEPPDQKPAGDNVVWIPGYWGWDDVRQNFIWVSGCWRDVPPGRRWTPGYWAKVEQGWQWTCGFWSGAAQQQLTYLPPPPDTLEAGPSSPPPSPEYLWVPGVWVWRESRFAWRPGFWQEGNPNWVYVPAHYVRAPGGCLFVEAYWDFPLVRRGLLFAPCALERAVYAERTFVYRPTVTVNLSLLTANLFCQPKYYHYCFGNYYNPEFLKVGIYPWFAYHLSHYGYEPIFAHARWVNERRSPGWEKQIRETYLTRREDIALRPPRTFAAVETQVRKAGTTVNARRVAVVQPLARVRAEAAAGRVPFRLERVTTQRRTEITRNVQGVRHGVQERARVETKVAHEGLLRGNVRETRSVRVTAPRTPIVSRSVSELRKEYIPPARPRVVQVQRDVRTQVRPAARPRPEEVIRRDVEVRRPPVGSRVEVQKREVLHVPAHADVIRRPREEVIRREERIRKDRDR